MKKKIIRTLIVLIIGSFLSIILSNKIIENNAEAKNYSTINNLPKNKVGLLLGTVKYLRSGRINLYYSYRVDAAVKLFKENKIEYILVSGDNGNENYDEPTEFKNDLIKRGIPADRIILDYAGFRTLDSVVRAKEIFGQTSITIISQKFHNERAIYLAEIFGIKAVAFNAKKVNYNYGIKVTAREYLARVKVFVDLLFKTKPKFLGDKILIP